MYTDTNRAKAIHAESKRLEQFLMALSPEDWQRPSRCEQWLVADVVAHLIEDQHAERLARGLRGDLTPAGFVPSATLDPDELREQVTQHPILLRRQLGDTLLSAFGAENERVDHILARLKPNDWETLCYHPRRPERLRDIIDVRLLELAMHGWDIRASFDSRVSLFGDSLPCLLRMLPRAVRRVFRPDANRTRPSRYRLQIVEPVTARIDILLGADGAFAEVASHAKADVILHCEATTAMLVIFGRLPFAQATMDGRVRVEGEPELATAFGRHFQGR